MDTAEEMRSIYTTGRMNIMMIVNMAVAAAFIYTLYRFASTARNW